MVAMANPLESFIWGKGGAKMTPEQIAREREIAEALGVVDTSPVGHWTQGLARVANAAAGAYRGHKANRAERANADFNSSKAGLIDEALFGSGTPSLSGSAGTSTAIATAPAPDYASARVAQAHMPTGEMAGYIRSGLVNRGLPEHVADAFLMNFQDESGLDPGINERNPIVPGSRGGFGLYQLTGPRRRAYEAFAQQRGVDPSDVDAQLDFMMTELQGPEAKAAQNILSAPDTGTAAVAIVNDFLRPAKSHRLSRANKYMSAGQGAPAVDAVNAFAGGEMPSAGVPVAETEADIMAQEQAMAQQDPNAWAMPADPMATGALPAPDANPSAPVASSLTGHMVNPDLPMAGGTSGFAQPNPQVAQALMGGQANASMGGPAAPMPGMTQALIEALSDPRTSDQNRRLATMALERQMQQQDPMRQLEMEMMQEKLNQLRNPQPEQTAEMQNLSWRAQQAGLQPGTPEYTEFMLTGGRNDGVTVNNVMGGEKFGEEFAKGDAQALSEVSQSGLAATRNLGRIDRLSEILANTPQGAVASWQMIAGNYGLNTEGLSEIQAAQALINSLVPEQRPPGSGPMSDADLELFKQSLPRIINQPGGNEMIVNTMRAIAQYDAQGAEIVQALRRGEIDRAQAFDMLQGRENPLAALDDTGGNQGAGDVPAGVDPADWEYMTPEERALFQ